MDIVAIGKKLRRSRKKFEENRSRQYEHLWPAAKRKAAAKRDRIRYQERKRRDEGNAQVQRHRR